MSVHGFCKRNKIRYRKQTNLWKKFVKHTFFRIFVEVVTVSNIGNLKAFSLVGGK